MKKKLTKLLVLVMVLALACGLLGYAAMATGTESAVIFNGFTGKLEFRNALHFGGGEKPDLFPELKNLMPGDRVAQDVVIGCKNMRKDGVRITLRAENPTEGYTRLVEDFGHWVKLKVKSGETEITGDLAQGLILGILVDEEQKTVTVELSVDKLAGNELKNIVAGIDWVFTAETMPG